MQMIWIVIQNTYYQIQKKTNLTKVQLNDLVRDLSMSKDQGELIGSRLQGWKLLEKKYKLLCFS
jgi:hypothetical protein